MSGLIEILRVYGWQICLLALIGTILVGVIKTPINKAILKKLDKTGANTQKRKKVNAVYDSLVYIGNYLIALSLTIAYNFIFRIFLRVDKLFELSLQVWLLQNALYGIWKKLGLKGLVEIVVENLKRFVIMIFDKNKDGKANITEIGETLQDSTTNGKIDANKLFGKVTNKIPNLVINVANDVLEKSDVEVSTDLDKAKEDLKTRVIDLSENKLKF